jgi:hypothetical protein
VSDAALFEAEIDASPVAAEQSSVRRAGKIFECGEYTDKAFSLTEEEADAAIASFTPVPADYEHVSGPLDGQLGVLVAVRREGRELYGEAEVPAWLDRLLPAGKRKISLAWDRATKRINGWGWVTNPRISDAALMAAFSETGLAREEMNMAEELETPQEPPVARKRGSPVDKAPAAIVGEPGVETTNGAEFNVVAQAAFTALQAEVEALKADKRQLQAEREIDALLSSNKMLPAERASAVAAFTQALADDEKVPVRFSIGGGSEVGRADALRTLFAARPSHNLLGEQLAGDTPVNVVSPGVTKTRNLHPVTGQGGYIERTYGAVLKERNNG